MDQSDTPLCYLYWEIIKNIVILKALIGSQKRYVVWNKTNAVWKETIIPG